MTEDSKISILFVCMGNICRSPTAEGVFRHFVTAAGLGDRIEVDSAGTHAYHANEPADRRAQAAAERRGYSMSTLRARRIHDDDFNHFDYIIAMDRDNLELLKAQADAQQQKKIRLFLDYSSLQETEVPDPYYGGAEGFDYVLEMIQAACPNILDEMLTR